MTTNTNVLKNIANDSALADASGRFRSSAITTLFDGKIIGEADNFSWNVVGTGLNTYDENKMALGVLANQYEIYQSRRFFPYFSGKSQLVELTFDHFDTQAGVIKRAGYFHSSVVAPYDEAYDGSWLS